MKKLLKIVFVVVVILGLMASYIFLGAPVPNQQQASTEETVSFEGPDGAPFVSGPDSLPPGN